MNHAPIHLIQYIASEEYIQMLSDDYLLDFEGNQLLDTESLNISEFSGVSE